MEAAEEKIKEISWIWRLFLDDSAEFAWMENLLLLPEMYPNRLSLDRQISYCRKMLYEMVGRVAPEQGKRLWFIPVVKLTTFSHTWTTCVGIRANAVQLYWVSNGTNVRICIIYCMGHRRRAHKNTNKCVNNERTEEPCVGKWSSDRNVCVCCHSAKSYFERSKSINFYLVLPFWHRDVATRGPKPERRILRLFFKCNKYSLCFLFSPSPAHKYI